MEPILCARILFLGGTLLALSACDDAAGLDSPSTGDAAPASPLPETGVVGSVFLGSGSPGLDLLIDSSGKPIVAWDSEFRTHVQRWNGAEWINLLQDSDLFPESSIHGWWPRLALGPAGEIILAWTQSQSAGGVARWNGNAWTEMGAGSASGEAGFGNRLYLAISPAGEVIVSYQGEDYGIYVKRWTDEIWESFGGNIWEGHLRDDWTFGMGPGGPIVAWTGSSSEGVSGIYVREWDGSAWSDIQRVGAYLMATRIGIRLARNPAGALCLLQGWLLQFRQSDGMEWEKGPFIGSYPSALAVTPTGDWSVLDWGLRYREGIDGNVWTEIPSPLTGRWDLWGHSPALTHFPNGDPIVAWKGKALDGPFPNQWGGSLYVRRWNGTSWKGMEEP